MNATKNFEFLRQSYLFFNKNRGRVLTPLISFLQYDLPLNEQDLFLYLLPTGHDFFLIFQMSSNSKFLGGSIHIHDAQ